MFPPSKILLRLSRNEKTSRNNPKRIYSERGIVLRCFLDRVKNFFIIRENFVKFTIEE